MYQALTFIHSSVRWFVVISLVYAIVRAWHGYLKGRTFTKADNTVRHWTATIAHVQLVIGMIFYTQSPVIRYFLKNFKEEVADWAVGFYGLVHPILMLVAIVLITIGSAMAKRKPSSKEQFRTMLIWFSVAFLIIFIAIPWPFSPLANRPYFR